jgi:hypothetical protein
LRNINDIKERRNPVRACLHIALGFAGLALFSSLAAADPATDRAMPWGPSAFCAEGGNMFPYCHYNTYQQCKADVSGDGDDNCFPNPYYRGAIQAPAASPRRQRHS